MPKSQIVEIPEELWEKMMMIKGRTGNSLKDQIQAALKYHVDVTVKTIEISKGLEKRAKSPKRDKK